MRRTLHMRGAKPSYEGKCYTLRDRLMVGHLPLEQSILVRVQVPQQNKRSAFFATGLGLGRDRETGVSREGRQGYT